MTGILNLLLGVGGAVKDAYFNLVSLLLPGNGTNGAQNNTFLDGSSNTFTITRNGNTTQGTFSPFSQTGWGGYFNGSSNIAPSSGAFLNLGTANYTIEFFVYLPTNSATNILLAATATNGLVVIVGNTKTALNKYGVGDVVSTGSALSTNVWHHVAIVRAGTGATDTSIYVDGSRAVQGQDNNNWTVTTAPRVGGNQSSEFMTAYISNLRVVTSAIYSGASITVPIAPLTAISGTTFLTLQNNRFLDNGSTAATFTTTGSPQITPFSPFAPTQSYSASAVGGSGYFDGTGDELNAGSNAAFGFGTSAYTVELWVYLTAAVSATHSPCFVFNDTTGGFGFWNESGGGQLQIATRAGSVVLSAGTTLTANTWNHIVAVRSGTGANQTSIFVNGSRVANGTDATNYTITGPLKIGGISISNFYVNGYLSNVRIVKGSAVYDPTQTTLTVPTAPLTAITNTSLLLNFTNAGVVDATAKNVLETVGNAQISTTQSKWGGGSISVSSGNYLTAPSNVLLPFGTGDFTIEFWAYWNGGAFTNYATVIDTRNGSFAGGLAIAANITTGAWYVSIATQEILSTTAAAASWQHVAVTRQGTSLKLFVNGTQAGLTYTSSDNFSNTTLRVGVRPDNQYPWNGYIDDLRITKGYARYTANFTAPSAPFPVQ